MRDFSIAVTKSDNVGITQQRRLLYTRRNFGTPGDVHVEVGLTITLAKI